MSNIMLIAFAAVFALMAITKQFARKRERYFDAAYCALSEATIAFLIAWYAPLPLIARLFIAVLVPIEIISCIGYWRRHVNQGGHHGT